MKKAYIGLGSNLGDRVQNLIDARQKLEQLPDVTAANCSSLYVSSPVGYRDQPNFINCVLQLTISKNCTMRKFFLGMQEVENSLGRKRDINNRNAARIIDLDLLLYGAEASVKTDLIVPHPRIGKRLFVLKPLSELDAQLHIPNLGTVAQILAKGLQDGIFSGQKLHKVG